jgi:hypothetical protein
MDEPEAHLEKEQEELLCALVESHRSVDRTRRAGFVCSQCLGQPLAEFVHLRGGPNVEGAASDAEVLANCGLLGLSYNSVGDPIYTVTPHTIAHYEALKLARGSLDAGPAEAREYVNSAEFCGTFGEAIKKWTEAERMLWASDAAQSFTTIGHLCREAVRDFAIVAERTYGKQNPDLKPDATVDRLRSLLDARKAGQSKTVAAFLNALLAYWGTVNDLVNRQEHGAEKEGEPLVWEDARRVVVHSLMVMYEIDRALRAKPRRPA